MPRTRTTESKPLRYTLAPGLHSLIPIETTAGAACTLKPAENSDSKRGLKAYADPDGIARFYLRPSWECEEIAKLVIESVKDGKTTHHPLHIRSSRFPTKEMPSPARERVLSQPHAGRTLTPLSIDEALQLTGKQALARGYPLRPNPEETPNAFRSWLRAVSLPMTVVEPHAISNEGKSHGKNRQAGPANSGNWSGFELDRSLRLVGGIPKTAAFRLDRGLRLGFRAVERPSGNS